MRPESAETAAVAALLQHFDYPEELV